MLRGSLGLDLADCAHCPLAYEGRANSPIFGEAVKEEDVKYIVIGEGPGYHEVRLNKPFIGPTGKLVDRILKTVGSNRSEAYLDNVTLCKPPEGLDDKLKRKAASCCLPRLKSNLVKFAGKPILALGAVSAQTLIDRNFSISEMSGTHNVKDVDGSGPRSIIPAFHPAYILHSGEEKQHTADVLFYSIVYDAAKVVKLSRGEITPFSDDIEIELEDESRANQLVLDIIQEAYSLKRITCDTETNGFKRKIINISGQEEEFEHSALETRFAKINAIGLGTENRSISVPWRLIKEETFDAIKKIFEDEGVEKIFQNILYDQCVLYWHGFNIKGPTFDTLLAHHNAYPGLFHGLQKIASQFLLISPWKSDYRSEKDKDLDEHKHLEYCAKDTLVTARLRTILPKHIPATCKSFDVDMKNAQIAFDMHVKGIPVSRKVNQELRDHFVPILKEKKERILGFMGDEAAKDLFIERIAMEYAKVRRNSKSWTDSDDYWERVELRKEEFREKLAKGKFNFNPDYGGHIGPYLMSKNIPLRKLTKKGKISTDKEVLESYGHLSEVRDIIDYRESSKLYSTFVEPIPCYLDENNRFHTNWHVNKASGRWSCSNPTVQNWTKGDEAAGIPNIRKQVVAPPGRIFVGADFDKFEARIIGLYSQDPFILENLEPGRDLHTEVARMALPGFDDLTGTTRSGARDLAKNVEYGYFYNAQASTLWRTIVREKRFSHVTVGQVDKMIRIFKQKMPEVDKWHNSLIRDVVLHKQITIPLDGRRWLFPFGPTDLNFLFNAVVQFFAATIMNAGTAKLYDALPSNSWFCIQQHDSLVTECDETIATEVAKLVEECLSRDVVLEDGRKMNFIAKAKIGKTWAEV